VLCSVFCFLLLCFALLRDRIGPFICSGMGFLEDLDQPPKGILEKGAQLAQCVAAKQESLLVAIDTLLDLIVLSLFPSFAPTVGQPRWSRCLGRESSHASREGWVVCTSRDI
jgi:hypothetical protein